jgi:hypothetical protein
MEEPMPLKKKCVIEEPLEGSQSQRFIPVWFSGDVKERAVVELADALDVARLVNKYDDGGVMVASSATFRLTQKLRRNFWSKRQPSNRVSSVCSTSTQSLRSHAEFCSCRAAFEREGFRHRRLPHPREGGFLYLASLQFIYYML